MQQHWLLSCDLSMNDAFGADGTTISIAVLEVLASVAIVVAPYMGELQE